ncbi:WhiB family transcriptional regulator [Streptosporangium sp. NPDC001559]|uniref:WhiB family transcriptional regulator n=1 Tax=Streptosporangium sp. NPDC001559 TaxID=3366187 RepID=UPI0036E30C63
MKGVERAACRRVDAELFFPVSYTIRPAVDAAKAVCSGCPILADCRTYALEAAEPDGIWGGLTPAERAELLRGPRASAPDVGALQLRQALNACRERLDWTWRQVADALGVTEALVSKLGSGRRMNPDAMERAWAWVAEQDAGVPA